MRPATVPSAQLFLGLHRTCLASSPALLHAPPPSQCTLNASYPPRCSGAPGRQPPLGALAPLNSHRAGRDVTRSGERQSCAIGAVSWCQGSEGITQPCGERPQAVGPPPPHTGAQCVHRRLSPSSSEKNSMFGELCRVQSTGHRQDGVVMGTLVVLSMR